jgi:hypothetical protein
VGLVKRVTRDRVSDEERLYRNVRGKGSDEFFYDPATGHLTIESKAFLDQQKEPSVDRAKLRNFDPEQSRLKEENGIVTLITQEVRQMGDVVTVDDKGSQFSHAVDVNAASISGNKAHALIVVEPKFFGSVSKQKAAFKLLRKALARLATQRGWTLEPRNS